MTQCNPGRSVGGQLFLSIALVIGLVVFSLNNPARAQDTTQQRITGGEQATSPSQPHARPLSGTLVLWGGGEPSDEVMQGFAQLSRPAPAGGRRGRQGQRRGGGRRGGRGGGDQGGDNRGSGGGEDEGDNRPPPARTAEWKPGEDLPEDIAELNGLWVTATPEEYEELVAGQDAEVQLQAIIDRGGAVGIPAMKSTLFPFVAVSEAFLSDDHDSADVQSALAELKTSPGTFGLGVAPETAVVLRRRQIVTLGEESAVVVLPASSTREALFKEISGNRNREDLVGLSRGALARLGADFPPAESADPFVANGSLLIVGGGGMTEEMWQTFIDSAGGPDAPLVVLPTASNPPNPNPGEARILARMGATDVTVLAQNTPEGVQSDEFVNALKRAKGVWFGGGRQWNFVDAYDGTGAVELFHDVLARGGIIAGSSAGASIQAEYMVRGSPLVNTIMMAEGYERGFGFLPGSAVDQHFSQRDRFDDLKSVHETFPQLMCFGIDETTGIFIRKNILQVMGRGGVAIYDGNTTPDEGKDYFALTTGDYFDLKSRKKITESQATEQLAELESAGQ